ncbi:MAG TPA: hypothetical protein VM840_01690 [Actinomycetota bacterium]|nr:hypothetical protein [Actinomycetota bacterium]
MTNRFPVASGAVSVLLAVAVVAALNRTAAGDGYVRTAGAATAAMLVWCIAAVIRRRQWAIGIAFFLGLLWLISASALGLQRRLDPGATTGWVAWAVALMAASLKARDDARPDLHPAG